jgi:transcriptional regulator with XRE-family HTH domain
MQEHELTGIQIRSARGALGWSVQDLADRTGVGTATIVRYEASYGVPPSRKDNLKVIRKTLESAGIEFLGNAEEGPGIRIWQPRRERTAT